MRGRQRLGTAVWVLCALLICTTVVVLSSGRAGSADATTAPGPLTLRYHPPGATDDCVACHPSAVPPPAPRAATLAAPSLLSVGPPPEASLTHWWFGCSECHALHAGTTNLHLIAEVIDTDALPPEYAVKTGPRRVAFLNDEGPNSYADGDAAYDGVCEVCHTRTQHHRGDASGDHAHFAGMRCTNCHDHANYFQPTKVTNHPQAVSDCANCHRDARGEPDLLGVHAYRCQACHPAGFTGTILGPLSTWKGECRECHNPGVPATGAAGTPTKGHRCTVCHGRQMSIGDPSDVHKEHIRKADCIVCHGFVPDVGTAVGSGNRAICAVCHGTSSGWYASVGQRDVHRRHVPDGASCLACHGGTRPAVDVVSGPAVGASVNVCQICHASQSPSAFSRDLDGLHAKHVGERMDCGFCHVSATIQEDRAPMPVPDDVVRARLIRGGYGECRFCHGGTPSASSRSVHEEHVAGQRQWCHNCHEGSDGRPAGLAPPVTRPAEACRLCHRSRQYDDATPFAVHLRHAGKAMKCYACHQLTPPLSGWPTAWLTPASWSSWNTWWTWGTSSWSGWTREHAASRSGDLRVPVSVPAHVDRGVRHD